MSDLIHVLIVEDREEDAELMVDVLRRDGFELRCRRVDTEKDYLVALQTPIDLILSDWSLPQFSGRRALELVKECGRDIPFILVSGSIGEDAAVELTRKGVDDYILKDRLVRLSPAVSHALEGRRLREEKRKAEEALRESEKRYRLISENAGDVIWVMDPETGRFDYVSPSVEKLRGYTAAEVMAQPVSAALTSESQKKVDELLATWKNGNFAADLGCAPLVNEIDQPRKDGSVVNTEVSINFMPDEAGRIKIIGVSRDITQRKRLEYANALIGDTERQILALDSMVEIIQLVGQKVQELIENAYVGVTLLDEEHQTMKVVGLYGLGGLYDRLLTMLKVEPSKTIFDLKDTTPENLALFRSGRLEEFEGGLYSLLLKKVPKRICSVVEKELNFTRIYAMGFARKNFNFGSVTIFTKEDITPFTVMIETMVNQASIGLKRIRSEEALRASEEKFRGVMEQSTDGIVIMDDHGLIVEWNHRQEEIMGCEKNEVLARPIWEVQYKVALPELQTPELFEKNKTRIAAILNSQQSEFFGKAFESKICRKDGTIRSIEVSLYPIHIGKKFLVGSVTRDITERKQAEAARQESELLFQALFELSPDAITLIDPNAPNTVWPIIDCNATACKMNGYQRDEMIGKSIDLLNASPFSPSRQNDYLRELREVGAMYLEAYHLHKNGTTFPIEISTKLIKVGERELIVGIDRDITQRKQAEEALRESEARFRIVFENANDAIFIENDQDEILFANPRACKMMGYSLEQLVKLHVADLQAPEARQPVDILKNELKDYGTSVFEATNMHASGRHIPVEVSVGRMERPLNDLYISVVRDVTERKQAEVALRENEQRFREIFENMSNGVIIYEALGDGMDFKINNINRAAQQIERISKMKL